MDFTALLPNFGLIAAIVGIILFVKRIVNDERKRICLEKAPSWVWLVAAAVGTRLIGPTGSPGIVCTRSRASDRPLGSASYNWEDTTMKHGVLFRAATSIGMYFFVIVLITAAVLALAGRLDGQAFGTMLLFAVGLAFASNKVADAIDPEDWPTFKAFAVSLWCRGTIVFLIAYPLVVIMFWLRIFTVEFFVAAVNGVITMVLADRHAGEKITANKESSAIPAGGSAPPTGSVPL